MRQILTHGLCHLEAETVERHLDGWDLAPGQAFARDTFAACADGPADQAIVGMQLASIAQTIQIDNS